MVRPFKYTIFLQPAVYPGNELGPLCYEATLLISTLHKTSSRKTANSVLLVATQLLNLDLQKRSIVGVTHYQNGVVFVDPCRGPDIFSQDMGYKKNDRLVTMHTSDHRRSVWYKN